MRYEEALNLLSIIEQRVADCSKGNILILTVNVVKATCQLIEVIELIRSQFGFLDRRVAEVRTKLMKLANAFLKEVSTEEEMRFYLLEKDLDERDSLNIIYDYSLIDLLQHPFA
jgi:hypothetical protein